MTRILLVEDHELNRYILSKLLIKMGFAVEVAQNGVEAIEKSKLGGFNVILMDMRLPDMNGWEVTEIIKSDPQLQDIPIIGLSAYDEGDAREQALTFGCDDYDTKPIVLERLIQKIGNFLTLKHLPSGAQPYLQCSEPD